MKYNRKELHKAINHSIYQVWLDNTLLATMPAKDFDRSKMKLESKVTTPGTCENHLVAGSFELKWKTKAANELSFLPFLNEPLNLAPSVKITQQMLDLDFPCCQSEWVKGNTNS